MRPRLGLMALLLAAPAFAVQSPAPRGAKPGAPMEAPGFPGMEAHEPKPYDKVVTAEARTQAGLLTVHQVKDKIYLEIPKERLEKDLLLVATLAQVPEGVDHAGKELNDDIVRFYLKDNHVYFHRVSHYLTADPNQPIASAVAASQRDVILQAFNVEAYAKDGSPVIEVSRFFTSEVGDFSARTTLNATMLDPTRSYVDRVKAFPRNLRVDAIQTYTLAPYPAGVTPMPGMPMPPARSASVKVAYSFVELPETPMRPRVMDDRVGFFSVNRLDYGTAEHRAKPETFINRWRLEKKDPSAALSEPVKPIVWYIDAATPARWVPFIKKGVEAWNVAFEAAGFKNAVQARSFPTKEEDPEFDPDDVRYSVIRWVPSAIENAYGPCITDPRTGEILNADIVVYHNIQLLQRDWYFSQVGPLDPRAATLPLPDDLMGDLIAYVVTHECGHSLGLPHNMKASSLYPTDKLRDKAWLKEMGHTPTLMDYCRFNYVVQPEDGIDPELLRPKIGPYDIFSIKWGYAPLPADQEHATLNAWCREQDTKPWLRFSTPGAGDSDPFENTEAVGDADAVKATTLGTKNLQRAMAMLPKAVKKDGEDDEDLDHLYAVLWSQWSNELNHVAVLVGGFDSQNKHQGQEGAVFTPVPKARQQEAVRYLGKAVFQTPDWLLPSAILDRLSPAEGGRRLLNLQKRVLNTVLQRRRVARLQEHEMLLGDKAYRVQDLLADLRAGLFTELSAPKPAVAPLRRNLQRAYLDLLDDRINHGNPVLPVQYQAYGYPELPDDSRAAFRAELKSLQTQIAAKAPLAAQPTRAHLEDLKDRIARILDPHPTATAAQPAPAARRSRACWPDPTELAD
jgi:hypothetical protein